ncbi:MAG: hypothetical protein JW811_07665 [Clostridiales bacterium]|nr:hypothetical protein [Clostridiales bacterium]
MFTLQWDMILFGCIGGIVAELLRIVKNLKEVSAKETSDIMTSLLSMLILAVVGGLTVYVIGESIKTVLDALLVGYAAPEILSRLAANKVPTLVGRGVRTKTANVFEWWRY